MNVSIVIPTYSNTKGLEKLLSFLVDLDAEVIVVDNAPTEFKERFVYDFNFVYLPEGKNDGFAKAVNDGVKRAKGEWVAIVNDDIKIPSQKIFQNLIDTATKNNWSAVSPILKNELGQIENLGYFVLPIGKAKLNFDKENSSFNASENLTNRHPELGSGSNIKENSSHPIDGLTAACLLVKKTAYDKLNGLDETFFAYLEDVDFFLRFKKAEYFFGVDLKTEVTHTKHQTAITMPKGFKEERDFYNWIRILYKQYGFWYFFKKDVFLERLRNLNGWLKAMR